LKLLTLLLCPCQYETTQFKSNQSHTVYAETYILKKIVSVITSSVSAIMRYLVTFRVKGCLNIDHVSYTII
jgi:hypothetical protein